MKPIVLLVIHFIKLFPRTKVFCFEELNIREGGDAEIRLFMISLLDPLTVLFVSNQNLSFSLLKLFLRSADILMRTDPPDSLISYGSPSCLTV